MPAEHHEQGPTDMNSKPTPSAWEKEWEKHQHQNRTLRAQRPVWRSVWRGLNLHCPCCGNHPLLASYLGAVQACTGCGEVFDHIRTDDVAPWVTILFLGHVLLPAVISVEKLFEPPLWAHFLIWMPIGAEMVRTALPRAKGAVLGLMWSLNLQGNEHQH